MSVVPSVGNAMSPWSSYGWDLVNRVGREIGDLAYRSGVSEYNAWLDSQNVNPYGINFNYPAGMVSKYATTPISRSGFFSTPSGNTWKPPFKIQNVSGSSKSTGGMVRINPWLSDYNMYDKYGKYNTKKRKQYMKNIVGESSNNVTGGGNNKITSGGIKKTKKQKYSKKRSMGD